VKVLLSLSLVLKSWKCLLNLVACRGRDENLFCVRSISYYLLLVIGLIGSLENLSFHDKMCANISFMLDFVYGLSAGHCHFVQFNFTRKA
jgi:hypothetical protein